MDIKRYLGVNSYVVGQEVPIEELIKKWGGTKLWDLQNQEDRNCREFFGGWSVLDKPRSYNYPVLGLFRDKEQAEALYGSLSYQTRDRQHLLLLENIFYRRPISLKMSELQKKLATLLPENKESTQYLQHLEYCYVDGNNWGSDTYLTSVESLSTSREELLRTTPLLFTAMVDDLGKQGHRMESNSVKNYCWNTAGNWEHSVYFVGKILKETRS